MTNPTMPRTIEFLARAASEYTETKEILKLFIEFSDLLEQELGEVEKENDTLRGLLGNSALPCTYCGLAAKDQAKCQRGFPGCARADDQMLSQHFADAYRADCAEKELTEAKAELEKSVPFGWKLVPIEPTHDDEWMLLVLMCELHANVPEESRPVGWASFSEAQRERIRAAYKAMLDAAPTQAKSKSEYKRLSALGANVEPPKED